MKVYRVELMILDFDEIGTKGIEDVIENTRYANHCIAPSVIYTEARDIGKWSDDHPLNNSRTLDAEFRRLFCEK